MHVNFTSGGFKISRKRESEPDNGICVDNAGIDQHRTIAVDKNICGIKFKLKARFMFNCAHCFNGISL